MPKVITINRPDVIALIDEAAAKLTSGNKTEAVALAMRRLLDLRVGNMLVNELAHKPRRGLTSQPSRFCSMKRAWPSGT